MIKVAVIGCGYWGPNLIRNLFEIKEAEVSYCCDLQASQLQSAKDRYPTLKITKDYKDILRDADIDAVVIATPADTHYGIAKEFLLAGKHVMVEKPLTFDLGQAEELVDISKKAGKILMVGHTFEYNPAVIKAREYIEKGELGKVYYLASRRVNLGIVRSDINALWNLAPHDISILIYLIGSMPEVVKAWGSAFIQDDIEDVVFLYLHFPGNITAHVQVSWLDPNKIRETVIVGSKKMIVYDDIDNDGKIKIYDKGVDKIEYNNFQSPVYADYQLRLRTGDLLIPKIDSYEPLKKECQHFIDCIRQNKIPLTDGENGLRVVKVLAAAQKSLKNNGTIVHIK
ncbi:MAG: Gfo/Idh/MocA family oxidoreductase [Candidatus Omnitrophota bacterium]